MLHRFRAGTLLLSDPGLAAIERVRGGRRYHVLPGGQVEPDETPEQAASREALEELGITVSLIGLIGTVEFTGTLQYYYLARWTTGAFGTGTGPEFDSPAGSEHGSYRATWLPMDRLVAEDLRPTRIAAALQGARSLDQLLERWLAEPFYLVE